MMKINTQRVLLVVFAIILLINGLLLFRKNSMQDDLTICEWKLEKSKKHQLNIMSIIYENQNLKTSDFDFFYKDSINFLSAFISDDPVFVIKISSTNCSSCIKFILDKVQQKFKNFRTNDRILLIYTSENNRVSREMFGKLPLVTNDMQGLHLPIDKYNIPYVFMLDKDMLLKLLFVPDKADPEMFSKYLDVVKARYFE